jgi:hypothetical protein
MPIHTKLVVMTAAGGLLAGCFEVSYVGPNDSAIAPGNPCGGQCVPLGPYEAGWTEPALLWMGDPTMTPECPDRAPVSEVVGFTDPTAPSPCGTCACGAPSGTCTIPTTWTAHNAATCSAGPGSVATSFDAFAGWDGSCTKINAIPANKTCNGTACVQSISIAPLTISESACAPSVEPAVVPKDISSPWGTLARVCRGHAPGECGDPSELCTPSVTLASAAASSESFAQCLSHEGDVACSGAYSVKHVFYKNLVDNRTCSPCACDAPTGSTCTALVSAYSDGTCSSLVGTNTVDATKDACFDVLPAGQALLSKSVEAPVYAPGACQPSGGDITGEVIPTDPTTFCCLP